MDKFSVIINPLHENDILRNFPLLTFLPETFITNTGIARILKYLPSFKESEIRSAGLLQNKIDGFFVMCPVTKSQTMTLPVQWVLRKIIAAGQVAEKQGAKIIGLGPAASFVGDAGLTIARNLTIPVTTGHSYALFCAIEGIRMAAGVLGHSLEAARVTVMDAASPMGKICSHLLACEVKQLILAGKDEASLIKAANRLLYDTGLVSKVSVNITDSIKNSDIIITVQTNNNSQIDPAGIKPGALVCDLFGRGGLKSLISQVRKDVLVIEGGAVMLPGAECQSAMDACLAEAVILAMQRRFESFSLGEVKISQVSEITRMAKSCGIKVAGPFVSGSTIPDAEIRRIRNHANGKLMFNNTA